MTDKEQKSGTRLPVLNEISVEQLLNFSSDTYWGVSDPDRFRKLMEEAKKLVGPGYFLGDNLFTWLRNNSALEDLPFRRAWQDNAKNSADRAIVWRRYILACAAYHCLHLPGDFVECGVYLGTGIKLSLIHI